jgi:Na+-transporting methylmalonyl-CoA/oxaloacetate decarboxylase gamma subunit
MPRPLFRPDPGWLWLIAGLVIVFVATVVPAQLSLERDRAALRQLQAAETRTFELLAAHDRFLADLREGHPPLLRRLAASNLNRMPADHEAVLLAESIDDHPIRWLEASVPAPVGDSVVQAPSLLETLVSGRSRLWIVGFGLLCLFVGLLLSPMRGRSKATSRSSPIAPAPPDRSESKHSADDPSRWRPVTVQSIAAAGGSLAAVELPTTTSSFVEEGSEGVTDAETDDPEIEDAAEEFAEDEEEDAEVEDAEEELEDDEDEEELEDEDGEEDLEDDEEDAEVEDAEEELEDDEEEDDEEEDDEEEDAED